MRFQINLFTALLVVVFTSQLAHSQVVKFRLETTDLSGIPIESINVGDEFLLKAYTQQVGGFGEDMDYSGVFAGYLDVAYDASLASISSPTVEHSPVYANGVSSDFTTAGLMDNIGGFSSSETDPLQLPEPAGPDEQFLFSVLMSADAPGDLTLVGSESLSYPLHEVLVWTSLEPVPAKDIDFGDEALRVDFGAVSLSVVPLPEPVSAGPLLVASLGLVLNLRQTRRKRC